jgi:DNA-binding PadR family transcriptional regulator
MPKPKTPEQLAQSKQQHVLALLTMPFYAPKGEIDAARLCVLVDIPWRGRQTPSGKMGEIKPTSLRFLDWFVTEGLVTKRDATVGRGIKQYSIKITGKGRERLEELRESGDKPETKSTLEAAPEPKPERAKKWDPIEGVDQVAWQREVHKRHGDARADLERRKRIHDRKMQAAMEA